MPDNFIWGLGVKKIGADGELKLASFIHLW